MLVAGRRAARQAAGVSKALGRYASRLSHPPLDGDFTVRGVTSRVEVVRDRHGVPHVFASTAADACFGHGFVHAQDRLFRMEGSRRLAAGRLSEVAGAATLRSDRLMRRLGLARAARRDAARLDPTVAGLFEAYARGVNEGVRHLKALPPEFALLGDQFEPWDIESVLLIARFVMFGFALNWNTELAREQLTARLGAGLAAALDPVHPPTSTVTGERYEGAARRLLEAYREAVEAGLPVGAASNAWAVTSSRTTTGAPLLASDPHVDVALPSLFHVAHLRGGNVDGDVDGDVDVVGAGIPGIPGVLIGHNREIAWGITAGMADVSDCYIEEFEPGSTRYRTDSGWAEAEMIEERIEVLDASSSVERVLVTRHGPVVSPALPGEDRAIALRSTALEGSDIASPFVALWRARSLDEAQRAIERWSGTAFNFVVASREDRVAYHFVGDVPRRRAGEGLFPQRGATSSGPPACWPVEELPRLLDPASGVVVSANNAPGGPLELGEEWAEPRRADRIRDLLDEREHHNVASFARIQTDRYAANLVRLRDLALASGIPDQARGLLQEWDGVLAPESAGGGLLFLVYRQLLMEAAERRAGGEARLLVGEAIEGVGVSSAFAYRAQDTFITALERSAQPWFDSPEDRDRRLRGALERATAIMRAHCGPDEAQWRLGAVQRIPFDHALADVPGIGALFSAGDRGFGGDFNTVVQAGAMPWDEVARVGIAPGYRQVVDLADWDRSVFMLPTGNSGIPGHPRYDDCIEEYLEGSFRPLLFTLDAVVAAAEHHLMLDPLEGRDPS